MVAVNGVSNTASVSVYRKLNGHLNGRAATQVEATKTSPDAGFRTMGEKNAEIRVARKETAQEMYEARTAHFMPANIAMEQAVQSRMAKPTEANATLKTMEAIRDMRAGVHAGPKPASVVHYQNRVYWMRMNGYL